VRHSWPPAASFRRPGSITRGGGGAGRGGVCGLGLGFRVGPCRLDGLFTVWQVLSHALLGLHWHYYCPLLHAMHPSPALPCRPIPC
jgi:hypothetical protein